jgi:hypothetical protein
MFFPAALLQDGKYSASSRSVTVRESSYDAARTAWL